jgi:hypothetical protein
MEQIWSTIGQKVWTYLEPWLEKKWEEVKPKFFEFVSDRFEEWMPKLIKAVIIGMANAGGQLFVNTTDKVTEAIPGPVDDFVVDQLVERSRDALKQFGIRF